MNINKEIREKSGMSQRAAVTHLKRDSRSMSKPLLSLIENGNANHTPAALKRLSDVCGVDYRAVITAAEYDYRALADKPAGLPQKPCKRNKTARFYFHVFQKMKNQVVRDVKKHGYSSVQSWFEECARQLHER